MPEEGRVVRNDAEENPVVDIGRRAHVGGSQVGGEDGSEVSEAGMPVSGP